MKSRETVLLTSDRKDEYVGDENLPPVRGKQKVVASSKSSQQPNQPVKSSNPLPKSYKDWDK